MRHAAEAMAGKPLGRTIAIANERVLAPLARFSTTVGEAFGRAADLAKDYFSLVNNFTRGPLMETGARRLTQTGVAEVQARHEARKAYDAIRRSTDDVAQIAKPTGRSEAEIAQIKNHLFSDENQLTKRFGRFDPDPMVANAWGRLKAGSPTAQDLVILQHEAEEMMLIKAGLSQREAHDAARAFAAGESESTFSVGSTHLSREELAELQHLQGMGMTNMTGAGAARPPRHLCSGARSLVQGARRRHRQIHSRIDLGRPLRNP